MVESEDKVKELFRRHVVNDDGSISPQELRTILQRVCSVSDADVTMVFEQMDRNADGRIVFDEFAEWLLAAPASTSRAALELPAVAWGQEVLANGCVSATDVFGMLGQIPGAATDETLARLLGSADSEGFLDAASLVKMSAEGVLPSALECPLMTGSSSASGSASLRPTAALASCGPACDPGDTATASAASDANEGEGEDDEQEEELCPVCHSEFWQKVSAPCSHSFCLECIKAWLCRKKTCPLCRLDLATWNPRYDGPSGTPAPADHMMLSRIHRSREHGQQEQRDRASRLEASLVARRAKAEQLMLRERERMRPEQERIAALVPQGDAFLLRVGHRVRGSQAVIKVDHDVSRYPTTFYVEAVQSSLPIRDLIEQVRFEVPGTHIEKAVDPRVGDWTHSCTFRGPKFEMATFVAYTFKAHIIWKEGLGMDSLSLNIRCATSGSFTACRRVAVELPQASVVSKDAKRIMASFRSELSRISRRS
eukprot:TRINITY_DN27320_c0_g1_i1.p1 TRINITY_DN27320_c0_g1~~TRINITY_DN27320_c0_g1_i1.p1  ORF type:complete len:496 (+),score=49.75 TRINITY_DN27320_c0_g1_i1:42-1490(+)